MSFARRWRMAELRIVNLFALKATDPVELERANDPVGEHNESYISEEIRPADRIVAAWGNHGKLRGRSEAIRRLLNRNDNPTYHLGLNMSGEPRHPLYAPTDTVLKPLPEFSFDSHTMLG